MKTLTISLADIEGVPFGSPETRTFADVEVRYTSPLSLTDGRVIPQLVKSDVLPSTGEISFEVFASDDPLVRPEVHGFAIVVEWTIRRTVGFREKNHGKRTVKVLESTPSPISFGLLDPAEPVPAQWVSPSEMIDEVQDVEAAATLAAQAASAAAGDAQEAATSADAAADRAELAEAAKYATQDTGTAALVGNTTTETYDALTTFVDQRSRAASLTAASGAPDQWWITRRSEDALCLVGDIGGGRFWSWALSRDYANPGGFRSTMTGNYSCVGVPMIFDYYFNGTFGGQAWASRSDLIGVAEPLRPGSMAGGIVIDELTVTAGSRNADALAWPGGVFPPALGHTLVVHGASGGGDLVTDIRNVPPDTTTIVMAPSPLPDVSGTFPATVYPARVLSGGDDTTATATYTTPVGSTRVGVSAAPVASAGVWLVDIDGNSLDAPNMLPTGGDLLDWGYVTSADMSTSGGPIEHDRRYLDFYYARSTPHRPIGIATGMTPGAHTVTLSATGVYHSGGGNCRASITGWAHGDESTTPATPGADIYGQWWVVPEESAVEFAHEVAPAAGGTPTFLGSQHGWEDQSGDLVVRVDGAVTTLPAGGAVTGASLSLTRTSTLHHPDATGAVADVTYEWQAGPGRPLTARHHMKWVQSVTVSAGYPIHCNLNSALLPNGMVDTSGAPFTLTAGDDSYKGVGRNRTIAAWGGELIFTESVPAVETATGGWSSKSTILHSIRDRAAGPGMRWAKTYMSRDGSPTAGQTWAASAEYSVALTFGDFTPPQ